ncbi:hypothetical protein LPW11_13925 [Geomonas sp. RF6]|uniref:hypothetical protein n=1 Tax=Geomonas sp. RF6 TaxID=2897342 RepID=UPI001E305CBE|nr:hypothetical protein [Geomonas sp. RF6]UFS68991.1 hypothetical protein LPW11_13925 [Geomonas sp. RF6]
MNLLTAHHVTHSLLFEEVMGRSVAYLILVIFGLLLWNSTGLFDGLFSRGNLEERARFWEETVGREAPKGTPKGIVDALLARQGISLECFHSSDTPPVADCIADDPNSKAGTSLHPMALQLRFVFRDEKLEKFETHPHVLR